MFYSDISDALVLFFFQAEDGIRDHCVTGVQTCALPIYRFREPSASSLDDPAQVEQARVPRRIDERQRLVDQAASAIDLARFPAGLRRRSEAPASRWGVVAELRRALERRGRRGMAAAQFGAACGVLE